MSSSTNRAVVPSARQAAPGIPLWPAALVGVLTIPLLLAGLVVWYATYGGILFGDVDWYAAGLRGLLSSGPLYDPTKLDPHLLERPAFFDQAPSTALITPLLIPADGWLWGITMFSTTVVGLALVWPRVGPGGALLLAPVLILWTPVLHALFWANVNGLVFFLLAAAWRFPRIAGVAVGLAAAIKLVPILAIAWLLGQRRWRGAAIALGIPIAATAVVLALKGPETLVDFVVLRLNQSMPPGPHPLRWGLADIGIPTWGATIFAACLTLLAWRFASLSLAVVAMLVSVPVMHAHYWTWLLVPFLGIWMPWLCERLRYRARSDNVRETTAVDLPAL